MNYMFGNEECSSGCESGWTLYLQQSSISPDCYDREEDSPEPRSKRSNEEEEEEEEEEDLSMVSDASSGPPQLHEEEGNDNSSQYQYHYTNTTNATRNKNRDNRSRKKVDKVSSLLDDTASSPHYHFCNKARSQTSMENVVEYSQGYSSTQFEVRAPYQEEHYDFLQSGNQLQQQNLWFEGKRW